MKKLIQTLMVFFVFNSLAMASDVSGTKISQVLTGPRFGTKVFVVLTKKPSENIPTCSNNAAYSYVFDSSTDVGQAMLSMVLTAYAAQKSVDLGGDNTCTIYGRVESLDYISGR